jgi:hypothetical protein
MNNRSFKPIVLFVPTLRDNLASPELRRDACRVRQAWRGELKIWLLPNLSKEIYWNEKIGDITIRVLAVPAEHLDLIYVYHIGSAGECWGIGDPLPKGGVAKLLNSWLGLFALGNSVTQLACPEKLPFIIPEVCMTEKVVRFKRCELILSPGPFFPLSYDKDSDTVRFQWPPDGFPGMVSPEEESHAHYGPLERVRVDGSTFARSRQDPDLTGISVILQLPKPLDGLLPNGASLDTLHGQAIMRELAERSSREPGSLLEEARNVASCYVSEGSTTQLLSRYFPMLRRAGQQKALQDASFHFNLREHGTARDTVKSSEWRTELTKLVPARHAWGVLGLFWTLLQDQLADNKKFRFCERCGRSLDGRKDKRFCSRRENLRCYLARRSADKRRERNQMIG